MESDCPPVVMLACGSYERAAVEEKVEAAFELLGGPASIVGAGESVFVKVNMLGPFEPARAVTTHPEVVRAVVRQLQQVTDRVTIGDSPGGPYNRTVLKRGYERTGMALVAAETGAELNFDIAETRVSFPGGKKMKNLHVCRPVVEADRLVSVSKLKTHALTGLTAAIKNHYGVVPGLQKFTYHSRFCELSEFADLLVDITLAAAADLHVVDGIVGMEGNGSLWGDAREMGILAAGRDPFAVDCALGGVLGLKPGFNVPLAAAVRRGLCAEDPAELEVLGDDPARLRVRGLRLPAKQSVLHWLPAPFMNRYSGLMLLRPYVCSRRCTACGKCADICPAGAVSVTDGTASIAYSKCIRCYCCHELCEHGGIYLDRPILATFRSR